MSENAVLSQAPDDPFDLNRLRLSQDFASQIGVKKQLITVPVRKPDRQTFVRTHPDPAYRIETGVVDLKETRETYLVKPELRAELTQDLAAMLLITTVSRQGVLSLWPIRLPDTDGRYNEWHRSALEGANLAQTQWLKLVANMSLGGYEIFTATGNIPDPEWPEITFTDIIRIAFKDHFIDSPDHPVCKRLRGDG